MRYSIENIKISIIGLGYVGLPLALELCKKYSVIGFDLDKNRINEIKNNHDRTREITESQLEKAKNLTISFNPESMRGSDFYIITVPTPIDQNSNPNLEPLKSASSYAGQFLTHGAIVIYESTVYPGCTEEICVPILEEESGLKYNRDFFCGYSPERINPGDKTHTLTKIKKITSGSNKETAMKVDKLYSSIINAGTYCAPSIAVAEAAKVIENTQRDVNIALINELALIFDKMNINTGEVLSAAATKWNFLHFTPGLVGGHCIGVDPYYLTHKAIEVGHHPQIILAGRRINDNMGYFIAEKTISLLAKRGINPIGSNIGILGITFKENCPDLRNTKVVTIIEKLNNLSCNTFVTDEWAESSEVDQSFGIKLTSLNQIKQKDAIILAVGHDEYKNFNDSDWEMLLKPNGIIIDIKSIYRSENFSKTNFTYWSL